MTLFRDKETGEEFELEASVGGFYGWNGGWVDEKWLDECMDLVRADNPGIEVLTPSERFDALLRRAHRQTLTERLLGLD